MKKFTTLEEDLLKEAAGAQEAFEERFKDANDLLLKLRVALEDYKVKFENEPRNWGYAGSLGFVVSQLGEALEHLGITEEDSVDTFKKNMDLLRDYDQKN